MATKKCSILYIGSLDEYSNSFRRYRTLQEMGYDVEGVDIDMYVKKKPFARIHYHFNVGPGVYALNKKVRRMALQMRPDILWVDNKPFITNFTLRYIRRQMPGTRIINLITDDPTGKYKYAWRLCLKTAPLYDVHFVQREVNIKELMNYGARRVEICHRSFDPAFHRKMEMTKEVYEKYHVPVGFIGTYEDARESFIVYLIGEGIPVRVTGNGWPQGKQWKIIEPYYNGPSVYGEEYIRILNGMDIALHFLRHANRDEQDSRTFEIPACGTFMLAESSDLHRRLFEDGKDAVFFTTKEELLQKVKYYLSHADERMRIAEQGWQRCRQSGYSHEGRLKDVLQTILSIRPVKG